MTIDEWPMIGRAHFSQDGVYRYSLERDFLPLEPDSKRVVFIMLNPSTANAEAADPTVRRCMVYTRKWGYKRLCVVNIFALRSTDPMKLTRHPDPIGPENDFQILSAVESAELIICAWGEWGKLMGRGQEIIRLLQSSHQLSVLKLNASGQPAHPLYLSGELVPTAYHVID